MSLNFYKLYNLINENVEENFDNWLEVLIKYAKNPKEKDIVILFQDYHSKSAAGVWRAAETKRIIIDVLKEKNLQNLNWFSFCVGYKSGKNNFRKEDLEFAIDVTKGMIDSGEITKLDIGNKGWLKIGIESNDNIAKHLEKQNQLSNREIERRKKRGEADLDEELVKLVVQEDNVKIYYLPRLELSTSANIRRAAATLKSKDVIKNNDKQKINKRHQILCKLGKDTQWCTAQPSWDAHEGYTDDDIYIIHDNDQAMYQFVSCVNSDPGNRQFMDVDDDDVRSLEQPMFGILNKHLKKETVCYNLKEFLKSVEDMENLSDIGSVDFISINRLFTRNSGQWIKKMSIENQKKLASQINDISWNIGVKHKTSDKPIDWVKVEKERTIEFIKLYELFAKSNGLEQEKKNEENILVRMFEKLLNVIDEGLKLNRSVNHIIHTFKNNLDSSIVFLSKETFIRLEAEIEKRKKIEDENMI
jgi:hypothetical protein